MSLINDALKQAKQSQSPNPPPGAPPWPPMEPKREPPSPWPLVVAAAFFGLAILIYFISHKNTPEPIAGAPATVETQTEPTQTNVTEPAQTNIAATATNAPVEVVEPLPKVQGIIYDAAHPLAIVDRKTLRIGDHSGDYKVTAISRASVSFQRVNGSLIEIKISQ